MVSCSKTEYIYENERTPRGAVRLQGAEIKKEEDFKSSGSTAQSVGKR